LRASQDASILDSCGEDDILPRKKLLTQKFNPANRTKRVSRGSGLSLAQDYLVTLSRPIADTTSGVTTSEDAVDVKYPATGVS